VTSHTAIIPNVETERLWQEWLARGAAADRRSATSMRILLLVVVIALAIWFVVPLT
jgi:hypothetical protein